MKRITDKFWSLGKLKISYMVIGLCLCAMFFLDISERDRNIILIGAFVVYLWGRYWDVIAQARKGGEE